MPAPMAPRVSVVMPVYNRERLVAESVRSVLGQTFGDLELLVVDDCSTDGSAAVLAALAREDCRVRVLRTPRNSRQSAARNLALVEAQGEFIALLDSDDVALPHRLATQVAFMEAHPEVQLLGGAMQAFGAVDRVLTKETDPELVRCALLFRNELAAPTAFLRRAFLVRHGLAFDETFPLAEDYDLWERVSAAGGRLANLPEVLVRYRVHGGSDTVTALDRMEDLADRIRLRQLRRLLPAVTDAEAGPFLAVNRGRPCADAAALHAADALAARLVAANDDAGLYPAWALRRQAAAFVDRCYHDCRGTGFALEALRRSPDPRRVSARTKRSLVKHRLLSAGRALLQRLGVGG